MLPMLTVSVVALIACGAFVMDVGAWSQGHRATQAAADASALAGAQVLPVDTGSATAIALDYSSKNGGGVAAGDIQFLSNALRNDTIRVKARRTGTGFLARVLGISTVNLTADAEVRAYILGETPAGPASTCPAGPRRATRRRSPAISSTSPGKAALRRQPRTTSARSS
jgi:Flp pilus assembly protein TadG